MKNTLSKLIFISACAFLFCLFFVNFAAAAVQVSDEVSGRQMQKMVEEEKLEKQKLLIEKNQERQKKEKILEEGERRIKQSQAHFSNLERKSFFSTVTLIVTCLFILSLIIGVGIAIMRLLR